VPFLSRIYLNPRRAKTRSLLAEPQMLHAAVLAGIPRQPVTERVLWRMDADTPLRPGLLVLTRSRPSWEHLVEQAGWPSADDPTDPQVTVRDYQPLLDRLQAGDEYAFRLTANPVRTSKHPESLTGAQRHRSDDGRLVRSARLGHRTVAAQTSWLSERAGRCGFELPRSSAEQPGEPAYDMAVTTRSRVSFRRRGASEKVVIQVVTYEGRLRITDVDLVRTAMLSGIGPAKAYGCGLLTLASIRVDDDVVAR
jgi:CRISPR system Cascade subunit CasE